MKNHKPSTRSALYRPICYAIQHQDGKEIVGFGVSIIAAWNAATQALGDPIELLQKDGYRLVEGKWHNGTLRQKKVKARK